jgi:hypothetical protein
VPKDAVDIYSKVLMELPERFDEPGKVDGTGKNT